MVYLLLGMAQQEESSNGKEKEAFYRMFEDDEASINFGESFINLYSVSIKRQRMNLNPERGRRYIYEVLYGHKVQCYNIIRMYPCNTFSNVKSLRMIIS
ncbi:hypothetical protein YC2023_043686 [Brassica napus]